MNRKIINFKFREINLQAVVLNFKFEFYLYFYNKSLILINNNFLINIIKKYNIIFILLFNIILSKN